MSNDHCLQWWMQGTPKEVNVKKILQEGQGVCKMLNIVVNWIFLSPEVFRLTILCKVSASTKLFCQLQFSNPWERKIVSYLGEL